MTSMGMGDDCCKAATRYGQAVGIAVMQACFFCLTSSASLAKAGSPSANVNSFDMSRIVILLSNA